MELVPVQYGQGCSSLDGPAGFTKKKKKKKTVAWQTPASVSNSDSSPQGQVMPLPKCFPAQKKTSGG